MGDRGWPPALTPPEPPAERLILGQRRGQQLQRHPPPQTQILGEVHDAHPTSPEHRLDPIPRGARYRQTARNPTRALLVDDIPPSGQRLEDRFNTAANPPLTSRRSQPAHARRDLRERRAREVACQWSRCVAWGDVTRPGCRGGAPGSNPIAAVAPPCPPRLREASAIAQQHQSRPTRPDSCSAEGTASAKAINRLLGPRRATRRPAIPTSKTRRVEDDGILRRSGRS